MIYDILQEYERRLNAASGKKNGKEIAQEMDIPYGTILSWIYRKKRGKLSNVPYMLVLFMLKSIGICTQITKFVIFQKINNK